jgi:hypothetical protein
VSKSVADARVTVARQLVFAVAVRRDRFEEAGARLERHVIGRREAEHHLREALLQQYQPVRITVGQRAQQHRVDDSEHGARGADRQGERGDDRKAEHWRVLQTARGVADVLAESNHQDFLRSGRWHVSPRDAATAALVGAQEDRGKERIGDQPSPRVRCTDAAEAPALAREAFDAGRLKHVRLTLPQVRWIRAKQQPNEEGR